MLPSKIIYSERTILRQLTEADAADFYALNADEEVLKYTGDMPFKNIEEAREFLRNYNQYKLYGVGRMAVIDKTSGKLMGWCGLKYHEQSNEFDIGFRFGRPGGNDARCRDQRPLDRPRSRGRPAPEREPRGIAPRSAQCHCAVLLLNDDPEMVLGDPTR
jgi:hypothetical protein